MTSKNTRSKISETCYLQRFYLKGLDVWLWVHSLAGLGVVVVDQAIHQLVLGLLIWLNHHGVVQQAFDVHWRILVLEIILYSLLGTHSLLDTHHVLGKGLELPLAEVLRENTADCPDVFLLLLLGLLKFLLLDTLLQTEKDRIDDGTVLGFVGSSG